MVPGYDDGGEGLNSRTIINPDSTGAYFIAARSAYWWHTGTYNAPPRSEVDCREWIFHGLSAPLFVMLAPRSAIITPRHAASFASIFLTS